jgi:hypothetical protein
MASEAVETLTNSELCKKHRHKRAIQLKKALLA